MIDAIKLKFGATQTSPPLEVKVAPITVFVGPNNSGKSLLLSELEGICTRMNWSHGHILEDISLSPWNEAELKEEIDRFKSPPERGEYPAADHSYFRTIKPVSGSAQRVNLRPSQILLEGQNPTRRTSSYFNFLSLFVLRLDGTTRLHLIDDRASGDLQKPAENHLMHLFKDDSLRVKLRKMVFDAFGRHLVIDPTDMRHLRLRLSPQPPTSAQEERGWHDEAIRFHQKAEPTERWSDGVKAFIGILVSTLAGEPKITLIDEPEAFLHPGLAFRLGLEVARSTKEKKRLFVSTHSPQFLMGCIQSGLPVSIIRLTYNYELPTARQLAADKLVEMLRNPLLRSTGVLSALFYESVVVTEGDSDRAFYQEINERLVSANDSRGITNCLFLNAQNKQTVWEIVKPLREMGIPAAGIVDLDVLKEGGTVWAKPLEGAFLPSISHDALKAQRAALLKAFEAAKGDMKREGINLLSLSDREACLNLLNQLGDYGAFVVPGGELESWLKDLGIIGHASDWLIPVFEKLGTDPDHAEYVRPSPGDVWDFIGKIKIWLANASRKGIPT